MSEKIGVIIPTYNEPDVLRRSIDSINKQQISNLHLLVINAGDPLPEDITLQVEEISVDSNYYWGNAIRVGMETVRERAFDYVLFANADVQFMPGTMEALLQEVKKDPKIVACAPAYIKLEDEPLQLLYSDQAQLGFLLYGKLMKRWTWPEDAPKEPFEIELTGGQGVLVSAQFCKELMIDDVLFPQTAGDHDLWIMSRKAGYKLHLVPIGGIINDRILGQKRGPGGWHRVKRIMNRMVSLHTAESWFIMWRLRRKHLSLPLAIFSTVVAFSARWTIGFPKMLRRT